MSGVNEDHFAEIEATLLYISEARERAEKARKALESDGAEPHLVEAIDVAESRLADLHRKLMHGTYFAVPESGTQLQLS